MSDIRIPRGNTFYTRVTVVAVDAATRTPISGFSLDDCTDLHVYYIRRNKQTEITNYTILDGNRLRIKWLGTDMKIGGYGLEATGIYNGLEWRFYNTDRYVFSIVESNEEANIPPSAFIETDYYAINAEVSIISSLGGAQADWNQTDSSDPSYIRNKPDLTIYVEKVAGYGLSKNDYSDAEKQKVAASVFAILDSTQYNSVTREVHFLNRNGDTIASMDATPFVKDGYLSNVVASEGFLSFIFNSDSEKSPISIPLSDLMDYTNIYTKSEVDSALDGKVDKETGKGLSTNDYTTTEKNKLSGLQNYDDTEVRSMINAKYTKPSSGIPATDLASGVIPDVSGFVTKSVNDLVNYYTKTQTYTQSEVNSLIAGISGFEYEVVSTLPTASASTMHKIYLTPSSDPQTQNVKDEYITLESSGSYSWELIGNTSVDLSGYVTTEELNTALASYTTTTDLNTMLAGYQTKIDSNHKLDYSLLSNTPTIPDAQIQSDWEQTTTTAKDYIKNKPTIPAAQVNSDWNASSGVAQILNKPTIPSTLAELGDDTTHRVVTDTEKSAWDNKANKVLVVNHGTDDTTYTLPPNQLHIWGTISALTISLGTPTDNTIKNEYMIQFTSGATATQFSLPQGVEWGTQDPEQPNPLVVKANAIYQISIENNIGLWTAISNS